MNKNKGFTLIELLAVIAVLVIILLIAVPRIIDMMETARKEAFRDSVYMIVHSGEIFESENSGDHKFFFQDSEQNNADNQTLKFSGTSPQSGVVVLNGNGKTSAALHNGTYCATKNADTKNVEISTVSEADCVAYDIIVTCDSWASIALKYDISLDALLAYNNATQATPTCGLDIKIPVEADSSSYDDFGIYYKTYYSMGYVADSVSLPYSYQYVIDLGNLPLPIANITSVSVSAKSVFESLNEFKNYIVKRNLGDVVWPGGDPSEIDIDMAATFQVHAAQADNMAVDSVVISCDAVKCQATIDVTVNNVTGVVPNSGIVYTPLKFTVEFNGTPSTCFAFTPATNTITDYYYTTPGCPSKVKIPSQIDGVTVTTVGASAFDSSALTDLAFASTITTIGASAFNNNPITSLTVPDTITAIGEHAFSNINMTGGVTWNNNNFTTLGSWVNPIFEGSELGSITLDPSVTRIPDYLFFATDSPMTSYTIPDTVTIIGDYAFGENLLTSITIPSSVTTIEANAFNANSLNSLSIQDNITAIGEHAFANNPLYGGVTWNNNNFNSIGSWSNPIFEGSEIGSITLGSIVTRVPSYLFFATDSPMTSYTVPDTVNVIGVYAYGENLLQTVVIPSSVTSIESQAFRSNPITTLTINNGVTSIAAEAFRYTNLTTIAIPNSVTTIGSNAFATNSTLTSATIDNCSTCVTFGSTPFGAVTPTYLR